MLQQPTEEIPHFDFIPSQYSYAALLSGFENIHSDYSGCGVTMRCRCCDRFYMWEELIPVMTKERFTEFRCSDCIVDGVKWCEECGNAYESTDENSTLCPVCEKENERWKKSKNNSKQ